MENVEKKPTLHLIDIENLVAGRAGREAVGKMLELYRECAEVVPGDDVRIAARFKSIARIKDLWVGGTFLGRDGRDGADHILLEQVYDLEWVKQNFGRVVLGTGDGVFAAVSRALRGLGVEVVVVSRYAHLAKVLREAASSARFVVGSVAAEAREKSAQTFRNNSRDKPPVVVKKKTRDEGSWRYERYGPLINMTERRLKKDLIREQGRRGAREDYGDEEYRIRGR